MPSDLRPPKRILSGEDATEKIDAGVELVAAIVGDTMGPKGWNVAIRIGKGDIGEGKLINTKDGVFVANQIRHPDPEIDMGVEFAVEASRKTNDSAGDGTTGTVVILASMLREARKKVKVGSNSILIQKGMELECQRLVQYLRTVKKDVTTDEEIYNVALVSSQDKEIAKKISDIIIDVGQYGTVGVIAQTGPYAIDLHIEKGMHFTYGYETRLTQFEAGAVIGHMQRGESVHKLVWENSDVGVLIFDEPIRAWSDVSHIFSACVAAEKKKLLIIADFHDDASINLQAQGRENVFSFVTINRNLFAGETGREMLKDIATFTGARFFAPSEGSMPAKNMPVLGIENMIGSCVARVSRDSFTLTAGAGSKDDINKRIALIMQTLDEVESLPEYDKQKYRERIARFKAGIGTVTIFAPTEVQQTSIRLRVDDAVCAVRSANEEGIVVGGGVALLRAWQHLTDEVIDGEDPDIAVGRAIVRDSLLEPVRKIADVAGDDVGVRLEQIKKHGKDSTIGYNYWTGKEVDLFDDGIIDPTKVVRMCVENAVSVVGELLRTRSTIVDMPKDGEPTPPPMTSRERALADHSRRMKNG